MEDLAVVSPEDLPRETLIHITVFGAVDEGSDLAKEFEELDTSSVDDELEALKKKLGK